MATAAMGNDRGSVSLWLVVFTLAVLVLLGFVVDGGQYMNARESAADIAEQAARAAADDLNTAALRGGSFIIPAAACQPAGSAATLVTEYAGKDATIPPGGCVIGGLTAGGDCEAEAGPPPPGGYLGPCVKVTVDVTVSPAIPLGTFRALTTTATEQATLDCGSDVALTGIC
jgi:Putative Flp pilus-assembly TadE/G-like